MNLLKIARTVTTVNFLWSDEKLLQLHKTRNLPVRQAAKLIGCTVGALAGKRKRLDDAPADRIDPDDWEHRLRETWEQRKARRKREAMRNHTLVAEISN